MEPWDNQASQDQEDHEDRLESQVTRERWDHPVSEDHLDREETVARMVLLVISDLQDPEDLLDPAESKENKAYPDLQALWDLQDPEAPEDLLVSAVNQVCPEQWVSPASKDDRESEAQLDHRDQTENLACRVYQAHQARADQTERGESRDRLVLLDNQAALAHQV